MNKALSKTKSNFGVVVVVVTHWKDNVSSKAGEPYTGLHTSRAEQQQKP